MVNENLEQRLQGYLGASRLERDARHGIDFERYMVARNTPDPNLPGNAPLLTDEQRQYGNTELLKQRNAEAVHNELAGADGQQTQANYDAARAELFDSLSDNGKVGVYMRLLEEQVLPEEPSDDLKNVVGRYQLAEVAESLVRAGKVYEAMDAIAQVFDARDIASVLQSNHVGRGNQHAAQQLVLGNVRSLRQGVVKELREKQELGQTLMQTVQDTQNYASGLSAMYAIYNSESEKTYRQAQENEHGN